MCSQYNQRHFVAGTITVTNATTGSSQYNNSSSNYSSTSSALRHYHVTTTTPITSVWHWQHSNYCCGKRCGILLLLPSIAAVTPTIITTMTTSNSATTKSSPQSFARRWLGAPNRSNWKKRVEKSDLDPNDQTMAPKFTETMRKEYDAIERRFVEKLDHERPGRNRGIECARKIVLDEQIEKKASTACGNLYLNTWIYRRFTLPLGYRRMTDVPGVLLANLLIREGTNIRFKRYGDPKKIILEMYRYPQIRPTKTQKKYLKLDAHAELTPEQADRILNYDDDDDDENGPAFTTPEEAEYEKRMIENTVFAANPYSDRQDRMRKRKP